MINIAPLKYRSVIESNLLFKEIVQYKVTLADGSNLYETSIRLNDDLRPSDIIKSQIYSNYDGSGTALYKNESLYKAVSETIERWAFYQSSDGKDAVKYYFNINPTTCGMSMFPELFPYWSRKNAILESIERFSIHALNRLQLPVQQIDSEIKGLRIYKIVNGFDDCATVILSFYNGKYYSYAFSCKSTLKAAVTHALVELARNERVLASFYMNGKEFEKLDVSDKRLVYFSTDEGQQCFLDIVANSSRTIKTKAKLLLDTEIKGPWSKYGIVWRHLFDESYDDAESGYKYFMF